MTREEFKAVFTSLARIEMLIKVIMQAQYGEKEANRVYQEVTELMNKELFKDE